MPVKELIALLAKCNPDGQVLMYDKRDGEDLTFSISEDHTPEVLEIWVDTE